MDVDVYNFDGFWGKSWAFECSRHCLYITSLLSFEFLLMKNSFMRIVNFWISGNIARVMVTVAQES